MLDVQNLYAVRRDQGYFGVVQKIEVGQVRGALQLSDLHHLLVVDDGDPRLAAGHDQLLVHLDDFHNIVRVLVQLDRVDHLLPRHVPLDYLLVRVAADDPFLVDDLQAGDVD